MSWRVHLDKLFSRNGPEVNLTKTVFCQKIFFQSFNLEIFPNLPIGNKLFPIGVLNFHVARTIRGQIIR